MISTIYRNLRRSARHVSKPALLILNGWQRHQSEMEIQRLRDMREDLAKLEQVEHINQVRLAIHRTEIVRY